MVPRRVPERTCVGCRGAAAKAFLVRVVRGTDGAVRVDRSGRAPGRGAYVHADPVCVSKALRAGGLARALRVAVGSSEAASLRRDLIGDMGER